MKHKFHDNPLIDRKGKKFRPALEKCLNDLPQDLAAKCFVNAVRVIEDYCKFHEIAPKSAWSGCSP